MARSVNRAWTAANPRSALADDRIDGLLVLDDAGEDGAKAIVHRPRDRAPSTSLPSLKASYSAVISKTPLPATSIW
jgi:hypothetical protein